jgi:hypothetical protein
MAFEERTLEWSIYVAQINHWHPAASARPKHTESHERSLQQSLVPPRLAAPHGCTHPGPLAPQHLVSQAPLAAVSVAPGSLVRKQQPS